MPQSKKLPEMPLNPQDRLHGFRVERVTPLPDIRAVACELVHEKSGAQVVHLYADDPENLLAIALRTPPPDDTGLPHILEHAVLCGSRRYPVKDPFVELLKTSLATFLNAMTYPDKTVYPCASMVEKDFFNVASVYCDAVFHPMLTEEHFKQEGHRLALADTGNPDSPLIIKGIVYNEMKGAYSDLDGIIERTVSRSICPAIRRPSRS
jgi:Zn-dependent M16 (insulinase) family peptidase